MILKELLGEVRINNERKYFQSSVARGFISDREDSEVVAYLRLSNDNIMMILKKPMKEEVRSFIISRKGIIFEGFECIDMENEEKTIREMERSKNTIIVNKKEYDKFKKKVMLDILNKGNKGNKNGN